MSDPQIGAELFAITFSLLGGVVLGVAGLRRAPALGLGLATMYVAGAVLGIAAQAPAGYWLPPAVLGGGFLLLAAAARYGSRLKSVVDARRAQAALILVVGPLFAIGWAFKIQTSPGPELSTAPGPLAADHVPALQPIPFVARTDKGRAIPLFRQPAAAVPEVAVRQIEDTIRREFPQRVIQTGPPDTRSDCHGWVFVAGHHHVFGEDVEHILKDNGYVEVTQPAAGDVIVYRDANGAVRHSGVVRIADGDTVMIESKWGGAGRYLHFPAAQYYSDRWIYYRSPRRGHELPVEATR